MKRADFKKLSGFTLIEMVVVVVIMGILAGFAVTSYDRARQKNIERTLEGQLKALAGLNNVDKVRNNGYWIGTTNEAGIDAALNTTIASTIDNATVSYYSASPDSFRFTAVSARYGYTARVDIMNRPCCQSGTCRYLPACVCNTDMIVCDSMCVHTDTDRGYCGNCSTQCTSGEECINGVCT